MTEWRLVVRRLVRCVGLLADACPLRLSGGIFAVAKDAKRDRLICDRRPQNSQEASVGRVLLPFSPKIRRFILQRSCALGVHIVDTRNCFYLYKVDLTNGTRKSSVRVSLPPGCMMCLTYPGRWCESDLRCSPGAPEPPDDNRQLAITGVMVGDTNAVTVLELAHRRQLINANVLSLETLLPRERPLPEGPEFGDVYIDDLSLFSILHMSRLHELRNCPRAKRAEHVFQKLAMPTSSGKSETGFKAEFWGGSGRDLSLTGVPTQRRTTLMYVTVLGALLGVTRGSLQQILGVEFCFHSFRREAIYCSDVAFTCARKLPTRRPVPACGALLDDLLLVTGTGPLLQADLRALRHDLFATDVSPSAAGACIAKVTP